MLKLWVMFMKMINKMKIKVFVLLIMLVNSNSYADYLARQVHRFQAVQDIETYTVAPWTFMSEDDFKLYCIEQYCKGTSKRETWYEMEELAKYANLVICPCSYCGKLLHTKDALRFDDGRNVSHSACVRCYMKQLGIDYEDLDDAEKIDFEQQNRIQKIMDDFFITHPMSPATCMNYMEFKLRCLDKYIKVKARDIDDLIRIYDMFGRSNNTVVVMCKECGEIDNVVDCNPDIEECHVVKDMCIKCLERYFTRIKMDIGVVLQRDYIRRKNKETVVDFYFERNP